MSDDNDFMGSSFQNYDTTENRMSDMRPDRGSPSRGIEPKQKDGDTTPVWKVVVGLIWGSIFIIISVSNNGRAGNPSNPGVSFLAAAVAVAGLIVIPCGKSIFEGRKAKREFNKAIGGFADAVREQRLKGIKEFIENNKGTELGECIRSKFDQIDKTDVQQLNSVWKETPEGKIEYEEWEEFVKNN